MFQDFEACALREMPGIFRTELERRVDLVLVNTSYALLDQIPVLFQNTLGVALQRYREERRGFNACSSQDAVTATVSAAEHIALQDHTRVADYQDDMEQDIQDFFADIPEHGQILPLDSSLLDQVDFESTYFPDDWT